MDNLINLPSLTNDKRLFFDLEDYAGTYRETRLSLWQDKCNRTPMDITSVKTLIASVTQTISKTIMLGDEAYSKSLLYLNTLVYSLEYAITQYEAGNTVYETKIQKLKKSLQRLQYKCEDICIYKEKYHFKQTNLPPTIEDNSITIPYTQPKVPVDLPPACTDRFNLPYISKTPYGTEKVFEKYHFTLNPNVDKMIIKSIYFIGNLGSYIKFKGQNLALGNNNVANLTDLNVPISFDEINDLRLKMYPTDFISPSGNRVIDATLLIYFTIAYKDSLNYSQELCLTGSQSLYE